MHKRVLREMQEKIRQRQYVMTLHAEEEMADDGCTIFDVERAVLTGEIVERQQDHQSGEWKYLITGQTVGDQSITVVAKLSVTNKLVVITMYLEGK